MRVHLPLFRCAALLVVLAAACKGASGSDLDPVATTPPSTVPTIAMTDEPAGANCPAGGKKLTVQNPGAAPAVSYVCNGQGGQNGSNGQTGAAGSVAWDAVGADTGAAPNHGYLAVATDLVTLTLPASAAPGDGLEVLGVGTGGFAVAAGTDQRIVFAEGVTPFPGLGWAGVAPRRAWGPVASSADGNTLVAGGFDGPLYVSTNAGSTWAARETTANWAGVAASADGVRLVAVSSSGPNNAVGRLVVSTNSGETWTARGPVGEWSAVASAADGLRVVAVMNNGVVWVSNDGFQTNWTPREVARPWKGVAISADGLRLVAVAGSTQAVPGHVYLSVNGGVDWAPRGPEGSWATVASSADGTRLAAATNVAAGSGQLYVSDDAGASWTPRGDATRTWPALALSADATHLAAVACAGAMTCRVLLSGDLGASWLAHGSPNLDWTDVALSRDGTRLLAAARNDTLYASAAPAGASALLEGRQGARLQLRHAGGGTWIVADVLGTVRAF